ncbi:MAG: XdhC /CoxI family-like protein [Hyphomicrobiales bacterium]|nr:MAG: XdhC /CoxI family-like protein [Hyphomicrobiales bacterium]
MDMNGPFENRTAELRLAGTPFAVATVVRTINATSAKPGAKAIIMVDGTISEGWVGGGCIRAAISKAAKTALSEGTTQFISLRPEEVLSAEGLVPGESREGVQFARNGCPSQGSMDIFIEPILPQPELMICGSGPVALALLQLAKTFNFAITLCAPDVASLDLSSNCKAQSDYIFANETAVNRYVVIATQGKGDEAALNAAVTTKAHYIGFVGSRRKFETLADRLKKSGLNHELFDEVSCPAGLNIGAITPEEIALSILSEITMKRRDMQRSNGEKHGVFFL